MYCLRIGICLPKSKPLYRGIPSGITGPDSETIVPQFEKVSAAARRFFLFAAGLWAGLAYASPAFADGIPHAWGINLQDPGSPVEAYINHFHTLLLWLISAICLVVLALLLYIVARYNK